MKINRESHLIDEERRKNIKIRKYSAEIFTATFCNKTQSYYYGINQSVSIEGISVEHAFEKQNFLNNNSTSYEKSYIFHLFMSNDSSQDGATK